jgi:hypothetical protein
MNKIRFSLALAVAVTAAAGFTGCVTKAVVTTSANGASITNFVRVPDVARISRLAGGAAQLGSQAWLAKNPNDRRYFVIANESLKGLVDSQNYDPAAFAQALSVLPMKELQGPEGSIIISGALLVWDEALASSTGLNRIELVAATLKKVQEGIQKTLDATAPRTNRSQLLEELNARVHEQGEWHLDRL